jgi:hypothetical protein
VLILAALGPQSAVPCDQTILLAWYAHEEIEQRSLESLSLAFFGTGADA